MGDLFFVMLGRTKVPIFRRPVDILIILLYGYFLFSCIFIERPYCAAPLDPDDSNWILKATYEFSEKYNPLFLSRPEWLQAATCISAYILSIGYVFAVATFLMGLDFMRIPILMFCSFAEYIFLLYFLLEFYGSIPAPNIWMFLATEGAYYVGLSLSIFRLRTPHHFSVDKKKTQ